MVLWLIDLSVQLPVVALVGRYPTNKLIGVRPISKRAVTLFNPDKSGYYGELPRLSASYAPLEGTFLTITHPSATAPTCVGTVRLACLRHAASVYPELGSNSQKELIK